MKTDKIIENYLLEILEKTKKRLTNLKTIQIFAIIFIAAIVFFSVENLYSKWFSLFVVGFLIVFAVLVIAIINYSKNKKLKLELLKSNDYIRRAFPKKAIEHLINAYRLSKDSIILEILFLYTTKNPADIEQYAEISLLELDNLKTKKEKDRKLIEILKQILSLSASIKKHNEFIKVSKKKIEDLQNQITYAIDENLINEFKKLINRYNEIIEIENQKIAKNKEKILKLVQLKHNFIITQRILKEREELKKLEDELWQDSISEEILNFDTDGRLNILDNVKTNFDDNKQFIDVKEKTQNPTS